MEFSRITTDRKEHLFLIGLNRPQKRNSLDILMIHELAEAYTEFENDSDSRCGILFAHGEHFTSGLDLSDVIPHLLSGQPLLPDGLIDPVGIFGTRPSKPIICAIQGKCLTAGIELALASDVRIAAQDSVFAQIEIKRGIFPFGGATFRMAESVGWGNAMRYLLTGDEFSAQEAYRMGFVQELVDADHLLARAIELGTHISKQAPLGVWATLKTARMAQQNGKHEVATTIKELIPKFLSSKDAQEGMLAFLEKREAVFKGE